MQTATLHSYTLLVPSSEEHLAEAFIRKMGWVLEDNAAPKKVLENNAQLRSKQIGMDDALAYVKTLSTEGGRAVPDDEKGLDVLIEEKYAL